MNKRQKALIILFAPFVLGFLLGFITGGGFKGKDKTSIDSADEIVSELVDQEELVSEEEEESPESDVEGIGTAVERKEVIYYAKRMPYAKIFADLNDAHISAAKNYGIDEVYKVPAQAENNSDLVHIKDGKYYEIDKLRYSRPYLTPNAAAELNKIGKAFADSLKSKQLLDYKIVVTSLLRTEEDVVRLKRSGNPNASINSAHCYGTTFDISYTRYSCDDESTAFMQPFELTKVLAEVLRDERNTGRILVKYERKEHCFHITTCL